MLRVLVVFTNLQGLRPICHACWPVSVALFVAMMASMVFHATVGPTVTTVWHTELQNGLDDEGLLKFILDTPFGRLCREHSRDLLLLDQLCALNAMVVTITCYGMPNFRATLFAVLILYLSDQASGIAHAILHSVWHTLAFAIADELITFKVKKE
jgi:hypothetical protein